MSKISPTPIGTPLFINRTRKLYIVLAAVVAWTLLTSILTFAAINGKYFHNTYECQTTAIQPIKTLNQPIDQKQSKLISRISTLYGVPKHEVYNILGVIKAYTENHKFPDVNTVLAVIATESQFKQHATSSVGAVGLMQITKSSGKPQTTETWQNIQSGVELLREYHQQLGSREASLMAYNIGIGAFQRGQRAQEYLNKVNANSRRISLDVV